MCSQPNGSVRLVTLIHEFDTFIQSDLQCFQATLFNEGVHFLEIEPMTRGSVNMKIFVGVFCCIEFFGESVKFVLLK